MNFAESAVIETHLAASPARVYAALTEAAALTAWYWPRSLDPRATSDPVVGGRFGLTTTSADMGFAGEYLELEPPRRIVQTWRWAGDDRSSRVTLTLNPGGDGVALVVVHDQLDAEHAERYRAGWASCLARLPAYLAATSPRPGNR